MNNPQDPPSLSTSSSSSSNKRSREDLDDHYESSLLHSNDKSHIIAIDNSGDGIQTHNVRQNDTVTRNKRLHRGKYDKFQVVNDCNHRNTTHDNSFPSNDNTNHNDNNQEESIIEASSSNDEEVIDDNDDYDESEEPDWDTIVQHEPATTDVPLFLQARDKRLAAQERFEYALDNTAAKLKIYREDILRASADFFNTLNGKMITIESQLKQDFVENDYVRSQMKAKLEHCASVAQAEFAQLIMKVTRVETSTGSPKNTLIHKSIDDQSSYEGEMKLNKIERNRNIDGEIDDEDDEGNDPDWDMIAKHQPATEDVPIFLQARDIRLAAEEQFAASLDEVDSKLSKFSDEILTVAADVFNTVSKNMIVLEDQLKHGFIENEKARSLMQTKLEQSASAAQEQFTQLMMRVTQVGRNLFLAGK